MQTNNSIIIFVLILTLSNAKSQDFSPLIKKNTNEGVIFADVLSNGDLYLLEQQVNSYFNNGEGYEPSLEDFVFQLEEVEYCFSKLFLLNEALEIKKELRYASTSDSITLVLNFQIDEADDDLVVFVANLQQDTTKFYMHWYNLDLELQRTLAVPTEYQLSANWLFGWHFIINDNNNIVYPGTYGFYEFDKYGERINAYNYTGEEVYGVPEPFIIQNSIGEYFSTNPQGWNYTSHNSDLSLIDGVVYALDTPNLKVLRDCNRLAIDNDKETAYITGFVKIDQPCTTDIPRPLRYGEFVYKYDLIEPQNPTVFFIDTPSHCLYKRYGQFAIDLFYDDYIYYSHSDKDCGFIATPNQTITCYETFITLKCLDDKGNLRWEKYLGGDAAYLPQGAVATPDSGVVVFVLRHLPYENGRFEADIYAAKFDKFGNTVALPNAGDLVPIIEQETNRHIKIYPNPITDYLIVEGLNLYKENEIQLYNSVGQLIFHNTIKSEKLDFHFLSNGNYTYSILENNKMLKAGKLLKW